MVLANNAVKLTSEELSKAQKKKWKETYQAQFEDIIEAESELQHNWTSREARNALAKRKLNSMKLDSKNSNSKKLHHSPNGQGLGIAAPRSSLIITRGIDAPHLSHT